MFHFQCCIFFLFCSFSFCSDAFSHISHATDTSLSMLVDRSGKKKKRDIQFLLFNLFSKEQRTPSFLMGKAIFLQCSFCHTFLKNVVEEEKKKTPKTRTFSSLILVLESTQIQAEMCLFPEAGSDPSTAPSHLVPVATELPKGAVM